MNVEELEETFARYFRDLARVVSQDAAARGFWEEGETRNKGEMIALMHSELSEALEGIRKDNPPDKHCRELGNVEVELADTIIRILDYAGGFNLDVGGAIAAKLRYNRTRPYKHGKGF